MKFKLHSMAFLVSLLLLNSYSCYSTPNISIEIVSKTETIIKNNEFSIGFNLKSSIPINVSAFRARITFDTNKLLYKRLNSKMGKGNFRSHLSGETLNLIYLTSSSGENIASNEETELFELTFKVLPNAKVGDSIISAIFDGISNYDGQEYPSPYIEPIDISISEKPVFNCDLATLEVIGFNLNTEFSPEVLNYTVDVPYSTNEISFNAIPVEPTAIVKVSRRTLNSAGKSTNIKITVSSPDRKSKKIYTVTVNRAAKDTSSSSSKSPNNKNSNKNNSKNGITNSNKNNGKDSEEYIINPNENNQKLSQPLVVNNNEFNFLLFFAVCAVLLLIVSHIIKSNNKK